MSRYSERKHSRLSKGRLFLCQNCNICKLKENMGSKNFLTYSKPRFQIVWPAFINCFVFCLITLTLMDLITLILWEQMNVLLQRAILFLSAKKSPVYSNKSQVQLTSFLFLCFKTHKHLTLSRRDQANENGWYSAADIIIIIYKRCL